MAANAPTVNQTKKPRRRGATKFPGIVEDAEALKVNRVTLYRVLTGKWKLPGLLKRYKALKRAS